MTRARTTPRFRTAEFRIDDAEVDGVLGVLLQEERPPSADVFAEQAQGYFLLECAAKRRVDLYGDVITLHHRDSILRAIK